MERPTYLGETTYHRRFVRFGIRQSDRLSHIHVVGKTGVGKTTLLASTFAQDAAAGRGAIFIDPHGDTALALATALGDRCLYIDAADPTQPYGYNPLRQVSEAKISLAAAGLIDAFRKLWPDAWGVRMEHVLRCSLYALLERPNSSLPDILKLYANESFRKDVGRRTKNAVVRAFWRDEFAHYSARYRAEVVAPIQNKLGALLADPRLYRMLVEPPTHVSFRKTMDEGRLLVVNLAKGQLGELGASTLGSLMISTIGLAALSRADVAEARRLPCYLYVDEFQSFTTLAFASLLAELRKYGLGVILAHQHFAQLEPQVRHAVLGNAGTLIAFRLGAEDAALIAEEFQPTFDTFDLINLPNRHFYLRLMIEGAPSRPFSARTLDMGGAR